MLSEEEKKAIEKLKETSNQCHASKCWEEEFCSDCYIEVEDILAIDTVLNLITKLQKENEDLQREREENKLIIAMANNEMLGYNQGYSDGKNQNSNATEIIIKNRQAYMHKEEVEFYKRKIEFLKKENEEKDKQIDLMANFIDKTGTGRRAFSCVFRKNDECDENGCRNCIKQYFERKVNNGD